MQPMKFLGKPFIHSLLKLQLTKTKSHKNYYKNVPYGGVFSYSVLGLASHSLTHTRKD